MAKTKIMKKLILTASIVLILFILSFSSSKEQVTYQLDKDFYIEQSCGPVRAYSTQIVIPDSIQLNPGDTIRFKVIVECYSDLLEV